MASSETFHELDDAKEKIKELLKMKPNFKESHNTDPKKIKITPTNGKEKALKLIDEFLEAIELDDDTFVAEGEGLSNNVKTKFEEFKALVLAAKAKIDNYADDTSLDDDIFDELRDLYIDKLYELHAYLKSDNIQLSLNLNMSNLLSEESSDSNNYSNNNNGNTNNNNANTISGENQGSQGNQGNQGSTGIQGSQRNSQGGRRHARKTKRKSRKAKRKARKTRRR